MSLDWQSKTRSETTEYHTEINAEEKARAHNAIAECIEKSTELIKEHIQDDSLYLLFEWNISSAALTCVLTNDKKDNDAAFVTKCTFNKLNNEIDSEQIQYWIRDYLTTCASFMNFSLVAAFHNGDRGNCAII